MGYFSLCFYSQLADAVPTNVDVGNFDPGTGLISFAGLNCRGNESSLADCPHNEVTYYWYCSHRQDVGVICQPTHNYIVTPNTSTPEATSSNDSAAIIGGAMGGILILVILLLVLVIIIAAVVVQRKKAAVQSFQLEVLAR